MDSYAFTAVITTADTLTIAYIPPNKKITSVEVFLPAITPTSATIQVGITANTSRFITSGATVRLGAAGALIANTAISTNVTGAGSYVTTGTTTTAIVLQVGVTAMTAPTAGTIYSIVRYT